MYAKKPIQNHKTLVAIRNCWYLKGSRLSKGSPEISRVWDLVACEITSKILEAGSSGYKRDEKGKGEQTLKHLN